MEEYLSLASEDSKLRSEETSPFPPKSDGNQVPIKKEPSFSQWCTDDTPQSPNSTEIGVFDLAQEAPSSSLFPTTSRKLKTFLTNPTFAEYVCRSSNDDNAEKRSSSPVSFDLEIDDAEFNGEDGDGKTGFGLAPPKSPITMAVLLKTLFFVFVWYALSSCLTIYNKTLLGEKLGKFPAPLLMNALQFSMQAVMSNALWCYQTRNAENTVKLTWNDYFLRVIPTAIGTALDINLSNASLMFISVTFATMCKSGSPIFLLLFAFAFRLEAPSVKLFGIISIISFGVLLTVRKETEFHLWGFIFIILATIMSGFRWSLTQILLQKETYGLKNPVTLMSYVTPIMTAITLILSLFIDPWHELDRNSYFDSSWHVIRTCLVLLIGGMLAFCMVLTEYILVSSTSAVTVSIAGVIKEAITILVAVFYFDDRFTLSKAIGLLIIMVGVSLFNLYKYQKLLKGELSNREDKSSISDRAAKYVILDEMDIRDREI